MALTTGANNMSRLDPKIVESNRILFQEDQQAIADKKAVANWLKDDPEIGVLNGPKYYKIVNGEVVYLEALIKAL